MGRPRLIKAAVRLVVEIEATEKARLEKVAAKRGVSLGAMVREALATVRK